MLAVAGLSCLVSCSAEDSEDIANGGAGTSGELATGGAAMGGSGGSVGGAGLSSSGGVPSGGGSTATGGTPFGGGTTASSGGSSSAGDSPGSAGLGGTTTTGGSSGGVGGTGGGSAQTGGAVPEAGSGGLTAPPEGGSSGDATSTGGSPSGGSGGAGGETPVTAGSAGTDGTGGGGGTAGPTTGGTSNAGASGEGNSAECQASTPPPVGRLGLELVVQDDGLGAVNYAAQPPESEDWYLVDLLGRVWVYTGGAIETTPFLDLSAEVQDLDFNYDERGLLSIAFSPDYPEDGKVYVAIVPTSGANADHDLVLEFTRSGDNPLIADPASRRALLDLEPRGEDPVAGVNLNLFHNGSTVLFGPDGMLYVGMGDGGGQCNSANPGVPQDIASPYGKILRLDPSAPAPHAAAGNPFAAEGDARVLHYGLRNPFRFSFDSLNGDFYVGDVGQWDFEEISFAPAGAQGVNFGWPDFEGPSTDTCPNAVSLRPGSTHTPPIHAIPHGAEGGAANLVVAVVGGRVYRGDAIPELYGAYLFGEYYPGRDMGVLYQCGEETSEIVTILKSCDANLPDAPCFVPQDGAPALGEMGAIVSGNDGELYLAANNSALLKIVPAE